MSIHGFMDQNGQVQKYDWNDLDNKPTIPEAVIIDDTLTEQGQAADAKAVGDALNAIYIPAIDDTLAIPGAAADSKAVGDAIIEIQQSESGLSDQVKQALLQLAQKVAYVDANGQTYYQALYDALNASTTRTLVSIDAVFNQGSTVIYTTDTLTDLKPMLTVTAHYDDESTATITNYTLSGNLTAGTSIITVSYKGKTDTFNVTVTAVSGTYTVVNNLTGCTTSNSASTIAENASYNAIITANAGYALAGATVSITMGGINVTGTAYSSGTISIPNVTGNIVITVTAAVKTLSSITATFNQGQSVIYDSDSLDVLRQYLVVTATYADSTTATVSDYTLTGTLVAGSCSIIVSYGGKSDTFTVNVTSSVSYISVTWGGTGSDIRMYPGETIDNTCDIYVTIPFVEDDSRLTSTAADGGNALSWITRLYNDASHQEYYGWLDVSTDSVRTTAEPNTWLQRPKIKFGQETRICPHGYYSDLSQVLGVHNSNAFDSNDDCRRYLNAHVTTLKKVAHSGD